MPPRIAENYWQFLVYKLISVSDRRAENYTYLLSHLFNKDFIWMQEFPLDRDREEDGYALRNEFMDELVVRINAGEFMYELHDPRAEFERFCQGKKASCLEVILALCIRICNEVYSDNSPTTAEPNLFLDVTSRTPGNDLTFNPNSLGFVFLASISSKSSLISCVATAIFLKFTDISFSRYNLQASM